MPAFRLLDRGSLPEYRIISLYVGRPTEGGWETQHDIRRIAPWERKVFGCLRPSTYSYMESARNRGGHDVSCTVPHFHKTEAVGRYIAPREMSTPCESWYAFCLPRRDLL